jgi:paired small multidrug resistance pump
MRWYDVAGSIGVVLIVFAYFFLQLGRLASNSRGYLVANALGAGLILFSLTAEFNFSAFLIEAFWLAISLFGLLRRALERRSGKASPPPEEAQ